MAVCFPIIWDKKTSPPEFLVGYLRASGHNQRAKKTLIGRRLFGEEAIWSTPLVAKRELFPLKTGSLEWGPFVSA